MSAALRGRGAEEKRTGELPLVRRPYKSCPRRGPTAAGWSGAGETPPARALPTPPRHRQPSAERLSRSRDLLEAANASLHRLKSSPQELGTLGFECTLEEVDLEDITENQMNTIKACTAEDPGPGNCPALERSTFDKGKCLQGISEDLRAYRAQLRNLNDPQLLVTLDGMMEALGSSTGKVPEVLAGLGAAVGSGLGSGLGSAPFPERLRLCSVLQAFRIRSVTISRMLSFLSSL
ncbi:interleukin-12 subunit alpha [Cyanocitta cristata]